MLSFARSLYTKSMIVFSATQLFFSMPVFAAGFQLNETSPSLQGAATAGAAAAKDDVSAMFNNPATLSTLTRNQAYLGGSEILPHISMSNGHAIHTVNIPGEPPTSKTATVRGVTSQANVGKSAFIPDAYYGYRLSDRLVVGLSMNAPFGLTTKYYSDSVLRFAAVTSSVKVVVLQPALAVQINEQWSVGAGFQAQVMKAIFSNFTGPYTGIPGVDRFIAATNPTYLKADGWGYGYTLGTLYKLNEQTRFGVGYRSMISTHLEGTGEQYLTPGGVVPAPSHETPFNAESTVTGSVKTPAVLTVSAAHDINQWTLKASAQLNFWDSFKHLSINMPEAYGLNSTIQTRWHNAWFGAVGADYRATTALTVRGGVAYDQTPTRQAYRDARIPDADRVWTTVGASYIMTNHLSLDAAYAHIFMRTQTINTTQASGTSVISSQPGEVNQFTAKYKGSADILSLALRYSF